MREEKGDGQFYLEHFAPDRVWNLMQGVVVVGDVNPGASVCAKGNVVVLGCASI